MRKTFLFLVFVFCCGLVFGQSKQHHRVIVVMADQFNEVEMTRKTPFMDKAQRRALVIEEHKAFCQQSQHEIMRFLESFNDEVQSIQPFWILNGFSCQVTDAVLEQLEGRRDIARVYRDELKRMLPENEKPYVSAEKENAWHVDKVHAPEVWNYNGDSGYTGEGVIVAILDTGVNYNHLDIANSLWDGGAEFPHHGYDIVNHDDDPMDDHGHGSHCAGIVAGQGTAGTMTGVAPGAKIMVLKIMNAEGAGGDAELLGGIEFALEHGADILSCSFGDVGTGGYGVYRQAYETVLEAGVVAAVAAGNDGQTLYACPIPYNIESPGNCPPPWFHPDQTITGGHTAVVCIGATDSNDKHSAFSSIGPVTWTEGAQIGEYNDYPYENGNADMPGLIRPDISAPGSNITSLNYATNNGYIAYDGTSMATPCAAGVMALMLEANPELSPVQIDSIIELTAVKIGNYKKNNISGSGRIDALAAVNALFFHGPTGLTADFEGETVTLSWEAAAQAISYSVYRDGLRIANGLTTTTYTDHLNYGGNYTYYIIAELDNGITTLPSNYVNVEKAVDIETEVINNQRVSLSWNMPNSIVEGFESGDFYQNMWLNDANSPWVIATNNPHGGSYSAKSTNVGMFSTSSLSLAVNVPVTCVISFEARISCFPLNGGGFFIDNVQQGEAIKDEVPWTHFSYTLSPGNHLLEWKYANQLAEGEYDNAYYIDDITVGNPFNIYRDQCGSNPELIAENVAEPHYVDYDWDVLPIGQYRYGISNNGGEYIAWSDCLDKTVMTVHEDEEPTDIQRVTIFNTLGQVIYDAPSSTDSSASLLKNHPSGIYIVRILTGKGALVRKVVN